MRLKINCKKGLLGLFLLIAPAAIMAQEPADKEDRKRETKTGMTDRERIELLEEEVENAKLKRATKEYRSYGGLGPAASSVYYVEEGLSWGGYGEVKYQNNQSAYKKDTGDLHRFILYAGYRFNDWIVLNTEIEYEHAGFEAKSVCTDITTSSTTVNQGGGTDNATVLASATCKKETIQKGEVYAEFMYLDFKFHDAFQVAAGLQLMPVGITNENHEPTTFYSVERPYTESQIIPSTWRDLGVMIHGNLAGGLISYKTGVFNGMKGANFNDSGWIREGRYKGSKADFTDIAYVASLDVHPIEGLTAGGSYYHGWAGQNEIARADLASRLDMTQVFADVTDANLKSRLTDYTQKEWDQSRKIRPLVRIAEGHVQFEKGPFSFTGLFARGWIDEDGARALNMKTGKNIATEVEGGYITVGYNIAPVLGWAHKFVIFGRNEYVNTAKNTVKAGPQQYIENEIAKQSGGLLKTSGESTLLPGALTVAEAKKYGVVTDVSDFAEYEEPGTANKVNDRRIHTVGFAYYPHPNVAIKADYEWWDSKSNLYKDEDRFNTSNNKIDRFNLAVTFIF